MTSPRAKPVEGLSLSCAATEQNNLKRHKKAAGYVSDQVHEAVKAHCWYRQISQSDFIAGLVEAHLEQLRRSGQLTSRIIHLYRTAKL